MSIKKTTKSVIGSSLMLGVGNMALEGMGQGALIPKTTGMAGNMMGAVIPAAYGMDIMHMVNRRSRRRKRRK